MDLMRSVVLATCQGEKFISEQLESILPQLAPEDEVIVSDVASTVRTLEIVAALRDPRIRVIANRSRAGYVENFQRAVAASRGESVYFSDQDDVWLPNKIAVMDAALKASPLVASDAIVADEKLQTLQPSYFASRGIVSFSPVRIFLKPRIIGATLACRRQYLDSLLPVPAGIPHDFWLSINAALDRSLAIVDTPLILYRRHTATASPTATGNKRPLQVMLMERSRLSIALCRRRLFARKSALTAAEHRRPNH
jgi:glycosyltransferase involved in cell wall biosynthesis